MEGVAEGEVGVEMVVAEEVVGVAEVDLGVEGVVVRVTTVAATMETKSDLYTAFSIDNSLAYITFKVSTALT